MELPILPTFPEDFHFYVDGGKCRGGSVAGCALFARYESNWFFGGWMAWHLPDGADSYRGELSAEVTPGLF